MINTRKTPKRHKRPRHWYAGGATLAALLVCAGAWYFWPRETGESVVPEEESSALADGTAAEPQRSAPAVAGASTNRTPHPIPTPPPPDEILIPAGASADVPAGPRPLADSFRYERDDEEGDEPGSVSTAADSQPTPEITAAPEPQTPPSDRTPTEIRSGNRVIETARGWIENGKLIEARTELMRVFAGQLPQAEAEESRALLKRIADETIFGPRPFQGDPLVESYTIQSGDALVHIGRRFDVPYEIIMRINGIRDATRIRAGQRIKVPKGPFHARISVSQFRMDLYLGDVYVRSYRVGLGSTGTPTGVWVVRDRLPRPTYYPPASATDKRVRGPNDPENPLGTRWIGLQGVEGAAVGQEGYGIHGTIEPDSIGKAVSLGCVRMHNEEVEFVYDLLVPGKSKVTIVP